MGGRRCGHCTNWRCDEPLHLTGYCIIDQRKRPHGAMCDTCTKYQSMWEFRRPATTEEQKAVQNEQ